MDFSIDVSKLRLILKFDATSNSDADGIALMVMLNPRLIGRMRDAAWKGDLDRAVNTDTTAAIVTNDKLMKEDIGAENCFVNTTFESFGFDYANALLLVGQDETFYWIVEDQWGNWYKTGEWSLSDIEKLPIKLYMGGKWTE